MAREHTHPYAGMPEALTELARRGLTLAVLSNKPDDFTRTLINHYFPQIPFAEVRGGRSDTPLKPDPAGPRAILAALGLEAGQCFYVGDSDVGENCNFGCGTVTCNYDGKDKFRTTIGDYCFIGCNTNLVAPVKVGDGAYTAAGSTITKDVPAQALGIARDRQTNLEGWAAPKMEAYIAKKKKLEDEQGK